MSARIPFGRIVELTTILSPRSDDELARQVVGQDSLSALLERLEPTG